eukprot:3893486-Rhodomonas_salina.1
MVLAGHLLVSGLMDGNRNAVGTGDQLQARTTKTIDRTRPSLAPRKEARACAERGSMGVSGGGEGAGYDSRARAQVSNAGSDDR